MLEPAPLAVLAAVPGTWIGRLSPAAVAGNARPQVLAGEEATQAALREGHEQLPSNPGPAAGPCCPTLAYSTYLGGSGTEEFTGVAVDEEGYVYVTGITTSKDFPTTEGAYQPVYGGGRSDAFVAKLSPDGSKLVYATYLGGGDFDLGQGIAVDSAGNAYLAGMTSSRDFPVTEEAFQGSHGGGEFDAFVTKLSPDGSQLVYSTYLGGSGDEGSPDIPVLPTTSRSIHIKVDQHGNAYVKARTDSADFPTTPGAFQTELRGSEDSTVTKLDPTGSALVFSTFFGGSGREWGKPLDVDAHGNVLFGGRTNSDDLPLRNAHQSKFMGGDGFDDAYVAKLNPHGTELVFSTYLGGSGEDRAFGVGFDAWDNAFAAGNTTSPDFPTVKPLQAEHAGPPEGRDMWIAKFAEDGTVLFSTFYGGSGDDQAFGGVGVDGAGNPFVTVRTTSLDFPLVNPVQAHFGGGLMDAAVVSLDSTGSAVRYATYLGGSGDTAGFGEMGREIVADSAGNAYVTGFTPSTDFPTVNPFQPKLAGRHDGFVAKIAL